MSVKCAIGFDLGVMCVVGTAAGIAAGIPVVGVLTSQSVKRMHEAGVFVAVNDYHELTDLVKKHVPFDENCDVSYK